MGKYLGYTLLVIVILFVLEWFQIIDVPYLDIPDFTSGKSQGIERTQEALDQLK